MYTLCAILPNLRGEVLHYNQEVHPDDSQAVTFAAVALR
jgi:hypothetical protein